MPARAPSSTSTRREGASSSHAATKVNVPEETPLPSTSSRLRSSVVEIFTDAQRSTTGHRKLVVRLRKIQEVCSGLRSNGKNGKENERRESGNFDEDSVSAGSQAEKEFNAEVSRCLLRILPVKRTEGAADKALKFLAAFLSHASERDLEAFGAGDEEDIDTIPETPTSRLTFALASTVVPITAAKDKTIRFHATQIITIMVTSLNSIDDELYYVLRQSLTKRIRDKEPAVRVQAVLGLSRLVGNEEEGGDSKALLDRLLDILQNDTNAEMRRTLLLNLPLSQRTLPFLLERARDMDATTRRALYARLLPQLGDFRHLSLSVREKLLRWGLRDRDETVRKATGRLFYEHWIEDCAASQEKEGEEEGNKASIPALVELLERIDVVNSGTEEGVAHEAMRAFWEGRPDYREALVLDGEFWETLTPESVFMARSFNDFCREDDTGKYDNLVEEKLPEVTALAFYLHKYMTELFQKIKEDEPNKEAIIEAEFIVEQILYISLTLDYSDEVGRRKMFDLLRQTLAVPELSEELIKLVVEVLRTVCGSGAKNEAEFCSVVLEAIAEVHDTIANEDSFASAKSRPDDDGDVDMMDAEEDEEEKDEQDEQKPLNKEEAKARIIKEIMVNLKCLHIAQCMLQNVEGQLQSNDNLVTMLNTLVVPAVRSHEAPIRERGLTCLGLCCLLDKNLAEENLGLFVHCFNKGHEALQEMAIKILADILTVHTSILVPTKPPTDSDEPELRSYHRPVLKVFARALRPGCPNSVQAAAVISLAKLLLTGTLSPSGPTITETIREMNEKAVDQLLQGLVLAYFNPRTRDNLTLRQALTYFFPVYCHSRIDNARHMCRIAVSMVRIILAATEEFYSLEAEEDSDGELVNDGAGEQEVRALMGSVVGMLVEWTDERRVVEAAAGTSMLGTEMAQQKPHAFLHLRVAKDLLERVLGTGEWSSAAGREESKYLLSMLSKLYIPAPAGNEADDHTAGRELATEVKGLLDEAIDMEVARDATGRNALVKAKNAVLKLLATPSTAEGRSRRVGRTRVGRGEGESTVGDTTVASVATEGTGAQETTTIAEEQEGDGETEGEIRGGEEGESTVLARGMEQMRV